MRKLKVHAMANLSQRTTGIQGVVIWVSEKGNARHACRIKVSNITNKISDKDTFSMRVPDGAIVAGKSKLPIRTVQKLAGWVKLNQEYLIEYWTSKLSTEDLLDKLQKV